MPVPKPVQQSPTSQLRETVQVPALPVFLTSYQAMKNKYKPQEVPAQKESVTPPTEPQDVPLERMTECSSLILIAERPTTPKVDVTETPTPQTPPATQVTTEATSTPKVPAERPRTSIPGLTSFCLAKQRR